jgi:hypothetical protein
MMGTVALEARGIDWKREIPLNVSFALRLNLHASPLERQVMLYAIEQSLMPGETGKRFEYETARASGDELSAHFHDYDWADEVLHAQIGRRTLGREGITPDEARERALSIHDRTWAALAGIMTLGLWSTSSWQLLPRSRFLDELAQGPIPPGVEVSTIAAARDWVVPLSTTRITGASAMTVPLGHSSLVVSEEVYRRVVNTLRPPHEHGHADEPVANDR